MTKWRLRATICFEGDFDLDPGANRAPTTRWRWPDAASVSSSAGHPSERPGPTACRPARDPVRRRCGFDLDLTVNPHQVRCHPVAAQLRRPVRERVGE
jgi:hypothetical protein